MTNSCVGAQFCALAFVEVFCRGFQENIFLKLQMLMVVIRTHRLFSILVLFFLASSTVFAQKVYTKRDNSQVRDGAGSYYRLIATLNANTELVMLEKSNRWVKVQLPDKKTRGWIAENCLQEKQLPSTRVLTKWSSAQASRAAIAAAVKGFAKRSKKFTDKNLDVILDQSFNEFSEAEFRAFMRELQSQGQRQAASFASLGLEPPLYDARLNEVAVGAGIATRLASEFGLVNDPRLCKYVNMICAAIVEQTPFYDWDFSVFILNDESINGFACPGGYIFLTKGTLRACKDESELAAIIAHEIAHVVRRHGMEELTKRMTKIKAAQAFAELEEEMEEEMDESEQELEEIAEQSYERAVRKRLMKYEFEADRYGAFLAAQAGYDPYGIVRISETVALEQAKMQEPKYSSEYFAPDDARERIKQITAFVSRHYKPTTKGRLKERFARYVR